jgi:S1-C subfamily serine protease
MRLKLRVAFVSLAVLVTGSLIAPRATQTTLSPPDERPAPLLEEQTQVRVSAPPFEGVRRVRSQIRGRVVAIPGVQQLTPRITSDYRTAQRSAPGPSGFGVIVTSAGDVLTHEDALDGRTSVRIDAGEGRFAEAHVSGYEPATGLVLLGTSDAGSRESLPAYAAPVEQGTLAAAYSRSDAVETIVPVFITAATSAEYSLASIGARLLPGTPIYNLSGELLAIATGAAERPGAIAARAAADRLLTRVQSGVGQPSSIGVAFQPLDGPITRVFGQTGALVADTVAAGPAATGGVEPGDVLVAVGDTVVESPEAAHIAITSLPLTSPTRVRVRREERTLTFQVTPVPAFEIAALASGADVHAADALLDAREVFAASALAAAGVAPGARVITVNRRPVSSVTGAMRELRRNRSPVLLHLQMPGGGRFFAVVDQPS